MKVAVISGGAWEQFEKQLLANLPQGRRTLTTSSCCPRAARSSTSTRANGSKVYSEDLSADEQKTIIAALQKAYDESGIKVEKVWGEVIENRGSQITLSVLGQQAPLSAKEKLGPRLRQAQEDHAILQPMLPDFSIRMGGTTSIDVTKPGIDKAYGIAKLRDQLMDRHQGDALRRRRHLPRRQRLPGPGSGRRLHPRARHQRDGARHSNGHRLSRRRRDADQVAGKVMSRSR
jgi:phosphomannomutase